MILIQALKNLSASRVSSGLSSILYHVTSVHNLKDILSENRFRLSSAVGTKSERLLDLQKLYYLSTSRSKLGGFALDPSHMAAILVLDGRRLSESYSGSPVDYWGPDWKKAARESKNPSQLMKLAEMEDRVWSDDPYIEPASKYIKEVHILFDPIETDRHTKTLRKTIIEIKKKEIPLYVYTDRKAFQLLDERRATELKEILQKRDEKDFIFRDLPKSNPFKPYLEIYYTKHKKDLSKKASSILYDILYSGWSDPESRLEIDMHNYKAKPQIHGLLKIFKKEKIKTAKEFIELLRNKWES